MARDGSSVLTRIVIIFLLITLTVLSYKYWTLLHESEMNAIELNKLKYELQEAGTAKTTTQEKLDTCQKDVAKADEQKKKLTDELKDKEKTITEKSEAQKATNTEKDTLKTELDKLQGDFAILKTDKSESETKLKKETEDCQTNAKKQVDECNTTCNVKMDEVKKAAEQACLQNKPKVGFQQ